MKYILYPIADYYYVVQDESLYSSYTRSKLPQVSILPKLPKNAGQEYYNGVGKANVYGLKMLVRAISTSPSCLNIWQLILDFNFTYRLRPRLCMGII